jgi:hypothetical protein
LATAEAPAIIAATIVNATVKAYAWAPVTRVEYIYIIIIAPVARGPI